MRSAPQNKLDAVKEFAFTTQDFDRVREIIYKRAGIALAESKQEMVYSRLARRLRATGIHSFVEYLDDLEQRQGSEEWEAFTNALTTNLTSFFREAHHFPILAEHVLKSKDSIAVWCSASSTGEEPYSIAMTICEAYGTLTPPAHVIATDIDTNVLNTAENGVYPIERIDKMSADRVKKFFLKGKGEQDGFVRVRPELRQMVTFKPLNLLSDSWPINGQFDIIFCRNVMIYFDKPTQLKLLERMVKLLQPEGLYIAGHSESFSQAGHLVKLIGKTTYTLAKQKVVANEL